MTEKKDKEEPRVMPIKIRTAKFSEPFKYKIVSDEEINLTLDKAYQFLELATFNGERAVSEFHVQFLFDELSAGRFMWHHILLAKAEWAGTVYRINGQHTCWMRVSVPEKMEPLKAACREVLYKVESEEQLRTLYATFDRGKHRSVGHVSRVLLIDTTSARDLPAGIITKMVSGFKVFWSERHSHLARDGVNINEIAGMIQSNYADLFNVVGHFLHRHMENTPFMKRAGVIGAMLATFQKSIMAGGEFWEPVAGGLGFETKEDPRYQLREFMNSHNCNMTATSKIVVSTEDTYRVCINAWNKWRKHEIAKFLRTTDKRLKPV